MAPPMQLTAHSSVMYTPTSDALDRHDYGISKNRKQLASTGGGRAWSEDEVSYYYTMSISRWIDIRPGLASSFTNRWHSYIGSLSSSNSPPEDALQAYCRSLEED